jgi:hypothetical protein
MPQEASGLSVLDYPGQAFDKVSDLLGLVGIELSPLASQVILLTLTLVTLAVFRKHYWPLKSAQPMWAIGAGALCIVAAGIVFSWGYLLINPLPDHVFGKVHSRDLTGIRISLVDFRGDEIPTGSGAVDSVTGEFVLRYRAPFGDRPRSLIISKPHCADHEEPVSLAKLRAGSEFNVNYVCREAK